MSIAVPFAPSFNMVRSQSGAVVVDPTGLTLSDYSLDQVLMPGGADEVLCYWKAQSLTVGDTVTLEAIILDTDNNRYVISRTGAALTYNAVASFTIHGAPFYLRVSAKSVTSATDLEIWAAMTVPVRRFA